MCLVPHQATVATTAPIPMALTVPYADRHLSRISAGLLAVVAEYHDRMK
jgi:hypothetical protein